MALIEAFQATDTYVQLKFSKTIKISSLTDNKFSLYIDSSTPVPSAFESLDLYNDYDTISRRLILRFATALTPSSNYTVTVSGLLDAAGNTISTESTTFATSATVSALPTVPEQQVIEIEDHSIRSRAFTSTETVYVSNPEFYVVEADPFPDELLIPVDYNTGRLKIVFSKRPGSNYINSTYFKVQKKQVSRSPSRWETVDSAIISLDADDPFVYINFPSIDATPVYGVIDKNYFENGYKYRVKVSKLVGG